MRSPGNGVEARAASGGAAVEGRVEAPLGSRRRTRPKVSGRIVHFVSRFGGSGGEFLIEGRLFRC